MQRCLISSVVNNSTVNVLCWCAHNLFSTTSVYSNNTYFAINNFSAIIWLVNALWRVVPQNNWTLMKIFLIHQSWKYIARLESQGHLNLPYIVSNTVEEEYKNGRYLRFMTIITYNQLNARAWVLYILWYIVSIYHYYYHGRAEGLEPQLM